MMTRPISDYRRDFPILSRKVYDVPLAYLDNAASSHMAVAVMDAMRDMRERSYANIHRGLHYLAHHATRHYEDSRKCVQRFIHARYPEEVIFTSGATDAINMVAYSWLAPRIESGDEIILSVLEHHSNIVPWHFLRERYGARLRWIPCSRGGEIDMEVYRRAFSGRTRMVAMTQTSNVLGVHLPVAEMAEIAHEHGVPILVDGCQGIVHAVTDVSVLDCDFYVFSGHKLYAPNGIGVLYGKRNRLEEMRPFRGGGEMIAEVSLDEVTYADLPHRLEAGTPPIVQARGLAAAIDYLGAIGFERIRAHEGGLYRLLVEELSRIEGVRLLAAGDLGDSGGFGANEVKKAPILSFMVDEIHPHDVAQLLDQQGVAVRAGHHCAQPLMRQLGLNATARASIAFYNNEEDVLQCAKAIRYAKGFFS